MHIVFATTEFVTEKNGDGGLANYLAKAVKIFADRGHRITVIVLSDREGSFEFCKNVNVIRVVRNELPIRFALNLIDNVEIKRSLSNCYHSFKLNQIIKEIHRKYPVDIVQYCHLGALGLFRSRYIPSVVRMSAFGPIDQETYKAEFEIRKCNAIVSIEDKLDFRAMRRVDGVFAPSMITAKVIQKSIHIECEVLETPTMGVCIDELPELPEILKGKKYFLFFGSLNNKKGLKTIVQSIYKILKENPQYYFVMVGKDCGVSLSDGMRTSAVRKAKEEAGEYQNRIIYYPAMFDRELLNSIIYHAEICILPYRFENLPNTCVEAMELGKIVISTYKSGISQLIRDGYNGFLVEQNNQEALINKIQKVVKMSDKEKNRISKNAIKRTEKMNPDNFYVYMSEYYQKVIKEHKDRQRGKNMKLEKTSLLLSVLLGISLMTARNRNAQKNEKAEKPDKWGTYYHILNDWMKLKENGGSIEQALKEKNIKSVAIYGMGDLGRHLVKDLENTNIEVKYAIDRSFFAISDIDIYEPESELPNVDAVIVTPVCEYENIRRDLEEKLSCIFLSIGDLV
mgnify:CR=1 FL=1